MSPSLMMGQLRHMFDTPFPALFRSQPPTITQALTPFLALSLPLRLQCGWCNANVFRPPAAPANIENSFCVAKNQPECHYSVRRLTGPRPDSASRRASKALSGTAAKKAAAPSSGSRDDSGGGSGGRICERRYSSIFPLKR